MLDLALVLLTAPLVVPVVAVLAALAALDGHNPFFLQQRVGRHGRVFRLVKLRTMVVNAEEALAKHLADNPDARIEWDRDQKLRNDPRITPVGRFLRKTSLDELPQIWNVLVGEMSLVGPRPMLPAQVPLYPGSAYYRMRPGITGSWQVSDRNAVAFSARARFDAEYEGELSLAHDLSILLRTVPAVLRGTGC